VPGLWEWLWQKKIREFEHDPRLCASITGQSAEELAATRLRWVAAALAQLKERGIPSPRERFAAGEPFVFARWMLGGNMWNDDFIREHPLVSDRSIRWLRVDAADKVTASEEGT
jgi:hypothetical protein